MFLVDRIIGAHCLPHDAIQFHKILESYKVEMFFYVLSVPQVGLMASLVEKQCVINDALHKMTCL